MIVEWTLTRGTPARIVGVPVTIDAGTRLEIAPPHDAGGVPVCSCYSLRAKNGGPAALAPFTVWAGELREQGCWR